MWKTVLIFFSSCRADFPRNSSLKHVRRHFVPAAQKERSRISGVRGRLWRQIWGRSTLTRDISTHNFNFLFHSWLRTQTYDNYNSTTARSFPHNLHHTLSSFTADKLRGAHAQRPQIAWNTYIQTRISWKISTIRGKNF